MAFISRTNNQIKDMKEEENIRDQDKDHLPGLPGELRASSEHSKTSRSSSLVELDRDTVGKSRSPSRSTSHSLLSGAKGRPSVSRKGSFAGAEQSLTHADRASVSMPSSLNGLSSKGTSPSASRPSRISDDAANDQLKGSRSSMASGDESASTDGVNKPEDQANKSHRSMSAVFGPDSLSVPQQSQALLSNDSSRRISLLSFNKPAAPSPNAVKSPESHSGNSTDTSKNTMDESTKDPSKLPALDLEQAESSSSVTTVKDLSSGSGTSSSMPPPSTVPASQTPNPSSASSVSSRNEPANSEGWAGQLVNRSARSSSRTPRRFSGSTAASSTSDAEPRPPTVGKIGVCALDVKARSKPSQNILTRLQSKGEFEVIVFGDKVILDEAVENWPVCDFLIAFFSDGFPLDKAIAYAKLRKPFCINDLPMQQILWDRRLCLRILDQMEVPTPKRLEVNRDGGPSLGTPEMAQHVYNLTGVKLDGPEDGTGGGTKRTQQVMMSEDGETLYVDGKSIRKPFVEKPVNGEDHNIHIFFPHDQQYSGGGRRLFRKIGNKSSEYDPSLVTPRSITDVEGSYLYEQFLRVDNAEDVKAYTVGPDFCHAETRKSPVVDGLVRRNTHGKELRYITNLSKEESAMAAKISNGFGQRICGFDMLRVGDRSYVVDVNGWSFVKDNNAYYDKCAKILNEIFTNEKRRKDGKLEQSEPPSPDMAPPRKSNTGSHRHALKTLLKSPSASRLHALHHKHHGSSSPDMASMPASATPSPNTESLGPPAQSYPQKGETKNTPATSAPPALEEPAPPPPASKHSWKLKGMVAVIRHADRTPKQKFKFTFHTQPFIDLLKGHQEEVVIKGEAALASVSDAVNVAMRQGIEDMEKLKMLQASLLRKGGWPGTKVQIKPMFRKRKPDEVRKDMLTADPSVSAAQPVPDDPQSPVPSDPGSEDPMRPQTRSDSVSGPTFSRFSAVENDLILDKLQLVIKWGGEPTHAARYQSQDLGLNMRDDLKLMNKEALNDVRIFTSSERRVSTSAQIWASSFLDQKDLPSDFIQVRKDLLDDSNAAKDVMDKVKKKLKLLLREGNSAPPQFTWPKENIPEPSIVLSIVVELMKFHRRVMRHNFERLDLDAPVEDRKESEESATRKNNGNPSVASIQGRWCAGEDARLFKERWEKLFAEFCDTEKVDPSKLSELYDSMKFDALHNRQFLEWVFTPPDDMLYEDENAIEVKDDSVEPTKEESNGNSKSNSKRGSWNTTPEAPNGEKREDRSDSQNPTLAHRMGFKRGSATNLGPMQPLGSLEDAYDSYFKLYTGNNPTKSKIDKRLSKLRELYKLSKVLFDFVTPQEYGIKDAEKLEIGLLTSLPLLQEIVMDLEEVQASTNAKSFFYFTKESHIYTLLNCILEGGIQTKIARRAIPELDYLSQICFELYEARDSEASTFSYSIRISISPGCHTFDPLDVQLDSRHAIGCTPRRSLTAHQDWKEVIETLKAKFDTVQLPKSFLAVNLSDKHAGNESPGQS